MARGKKGGPSRLDLRRQAEAAEARDDEEVEEVEADDEGGDEDDDEAPKAKKPAAKKAAAPKKAPAKRTRAVKEVRMRAVWKVFDNSNKVIETFPFNQKPQAEELLARKQEEKKGTFYLQMVKEQMD